MSDLPLRPESLVVSAGRPHEPGGPIVTPIVLTAPYQAAPGANGYARGEGTDTVVALEEALGALDGGTATVFASGMAAVAALVDAQPVGTVAVIPDVGYSGTSWIFPEQERLGRMQVRRVDVGDTAAVVAALQGSHLLWLESTSNPLLAVPDLPALIEAAHAAGAIVGVDATFSTPLNVRPLDLGADVVMHSVTKYLAGHSDLLQGVLTTRDETLLTTIRDRRTMTGAMPGALECYLSLRGLRTLALRWERAQTNAAELARRLAEHPAVTRVRFPGLPDDPFHERAAKQFAGFGAMISFEVADEARAAALCERIRLVTHATSLGGVESLIERRAMHPGDNAMGVPHNLLRFSVGIEHVEDLWADLAQALG